MKTAFITGSSRGIGRAVAKRLADDGYKVIIHCNNTLSKAEELKSEIEKDGGICEIVLSDLCNISETEELAKKVCKADVLVLNASLQYRNKWENITIDECYEQLNCNFVSSLVLIRAAVPHMRENKWGRIITVGSVQEAKPHPDMLIYSSSKAAQTNMMRSLSLQLAKDGITVNNVAPGVISTNRNYEALSDESYKRKVLDSIPTGSIGEPEDIAGMVSLLVSDEGRYITGQSIYIDGGKSIQ